MKILLIIVLIVVALVAVLYFVGKKAEKKKQENDAQLAAAAQTVSMLIIDKKRMRLSESGLPQIVIDQTPKYLRRSKLPVVKAKIGPKITTLVCDETIFDTIPVKKEVKAVISGIYITGVKGLHGKATPQQEEKLGPIAKLRKKAIKFTKENS